MALLVRKIARAKWPDVICPMDGIQGDAISDLRTRGNTLSVWRIDGLEELDEAILALAASSQTSAIENMCVVWIPEEEFVKNGILIDDGIKGDTIVKDLEETHRDLIQINYRSLGIISEIIMNEVISNHYKRVGKGAVKKALVQAYLAHRITENICTDTLLGEVRKASEGGV